VTRNELLPLVERHGTFDITGARGVLEPAEQLATRLLKETERFSLTRWLLEVHDDVLGIYTPAGATLFEDQVGASLPASSSIDLYWAVIGLIARDQALTIEAVTAVVLVHELSHAYTHLGFDIDGYRWSTTAFMKSERSLIEGLAQYYTALACQYVSRASPTILQAYERILEHQSGPYVVHTRWLRDFNPEEVRLALLDVRRQQHHSLRDLEVALERARATMRPRVNPA
jgi:hypothetical protein